MKVWICKKSDWAGLVIGCLTILDLQSKLLATTRACKSINETMRRGRLAWFSVLSSTGCLPPLSFSEGFGPMPMDWQARIRIIVIWAKRFSRFCSNKWRHEGKENERPLVAVCFQASLRLSSASRSPFAESQLPSVDAELCTNFNEPHQRVQMRMHLNSCTHTDICSISARATCNSRSFPEGIFRLISLKRCSFPLLHQEASGAAGTVSFTALEDWMWKFTGSIVERCFVESVQVQLTDKGSEIAVLEIPVVGVNQSTNYIRKPITGIEL